MNTVCLILFILISIGYGSLELYIFNKEKNNKKKKNNDYVKPFNAKISYNDMISIVDARIMQVFKYKYSLDLAMYDFAYIDDIETEVKDIALRVISSFSDSFLEQCYEYITRDFLITYVNRTVLSSLTVSIRNGDRIRYGRKKNDPVINI